MDMQRSEQQRLADIRAQREAITAYRTMTKRWTLVLVLLVVGLTAMAVYGRVPFAGLAALAVLFAGSFWVALRRLRWEAMRFRSE